MTLRNLRRELMFSHFLLILLMVFVVGAGVGVVTHMGISIDTVLRNNYDSVDYAQRMSEALEKQQDAAMLVLLGQQDRAREQYEKNWQSFSKAFQLEANNITEPGEAEAVNDVRQWSEAYRHDAQAFMAQPLSDEKGRHVVFDTLEPQFSRLKQRVSDIRTMNQDALRAGDVRTREHADWASLAGISALVLSIGISVLLARRTIQQSLIPLSLLTRQAEEIGSGHWNHRIELRRDDEIGMLADSFNRMAAQLKDAWSAEEQRRHVVERMANMALDNLQDAVLVVDGQGMVVHANKVAGDLFAPVQEPGALSISHLVKDRQVAEPLERIVNDHTHPVSREANEYVKLQVDGDARVYRLRTRAMLDEERLLGAVAILEDVTHLRELDRLKTEFIGVASHELKTPVTSLLLSVQLLEEGAAGPLTGEQRAIVAAQKSDLQRLERTTRDLLEITRLESGDAPTHMEPVAPVSLVSAALESVQAEAARNKVTLASDVPADVHPVQADRQQITRVLVNLLSNAIRHAPGGHVKVYVTAGSDGATLAVEDDGTGIPADYLPRIFERFVQVPGATHGGAGLGLSIAQAMVTAHRSTIQVESTLEHGSTFRFTLAYAEEDGCGKNPHS